MNFTKCTPVRIAVLAGIFAAAAAAGSAQTSPDTLMQMDGNAATDVPPLPCTNLISGTATATNCDSWNLLNGDPNANPPTTGSAGYSLVRTFLNGLTNTESFSGGGSKDPNPLSEWKYSTSPTPNKDTLNAGFGALYAGTQSDYVLMFGADRASPSGDANIGIWFFQSPVTPNGSGGFTGVHTNGDVFVISAFTGGGGNSNIEVLQWNTACTTAVKNPTTKGQCADTNLEFIASQASSVSCAGAPYCAVTNSTATISSWEGSLATPLFFQGGINLSAAFGSSIPCFSSFLEETRSSASTSAVLKDFLTGPLNICSMSITKTCSSAVVNATGTAVNYTWTGTVKNTGVGTLSNVVVNDTLPSGTVVNPTLYDQVSGSMVTGLSAGETATYSVTAPVAAITATNIASATSTVGSQSVNAPAVSANCSQPVSSSVSVTKSCVGPGPGLMCSASGCVVEVPISAQVCNKGQVQLNGITLSDSPAVTNLNPSSFSGLDPGDCTNFTGTYQPTMYDASSNGSTGGRYTFTDTISVTSATPLFGPPVSPVGGTLCPAGSLGCAAATCPLCSLGECTLTALPPPLP